MSKYVLLALVVISIKNGFCENEKKINCRNLPNGSYAVGCSQNYTVCYNINVERKCPDNLYYNTFEGKCDEKKNVKQCRNPSQHKDEVMRSRCVGWKHGYYSIGCSSSHFSCFYGQIHWYNCEDPSQRYDINDDLCKDPELVPECQKFLARFQDSIPIRKNESAPVEKIGNSDKSPPSINPQPTPTPSKPQPPQKKQSTISQSGKASSILGALQPSLSIAPIEPPSSMIEVSVSDLNTPSRGSWGAQPTKNHEHQTTHTIWKPTGDNSVARNRQHFNYEESSDDSIEFDEVIGPNWSN